jgi:hypothetical protein
MDMLQPSPARHPAARPPGPGEQASQHRPPLPREQARRHLTAIAASLTGHGIPSRLTSIGGVPVLTIEDTTGPHPATIAIDPDLATSTGQPLDCTCLWTPPPGTAPEATAATIRAVLNIIRPAATGPGSRQDTTLRQ